MRVMYSKTLLGAVAVSGALLAGCGFNFAGTYQGSVTEAIDVCTAQFDLAPTLAFTGFGSGSPVAMNYAVTGTLDITVTGPEPCPIVVNSTLAGTATSDSPDVLTLAATLTSGCAGAGCPESMTYDGNGSDADADNNVDTILGDLIVQPTDDVALGPFSLTLTRVP
ncbi:MAG: hypothetical protein U0610_20765 [bacterium]